jgi:hypothetical protein
LQIADKGVKLALSGRNTAFSFHSIYWVPNLNPHIDSWNGKRVLIATDLSRRIASYVKSRYIRKLARALEG